ncbi:uncharacterized protein METZ01_LOCUS506862, partial [marine metagenome]
MDNFGLSYLMRWSVRFFWVCLLTLILSGCTKEPEVVSKKVNPRLAKSGKKLVEEPKVAIAPDSSESLNLGPRDDGKSSGAGGDSVVAGPTAPVVPTRAEMQQLIRRAQA